MEPTTSTAGNPPSDNSIRGFSRRNRIYVLREFLWRVYREQLLASRGQGVILDVAGGKGDLSWLLVNVDNAVSVVVDPRVTKNHLIKSVNFLRANPDLAKERAVPGRPTHQPLAELVPKLQGKDTFQTPQHLRILMDQDLVDAVRAVRTNPADHDSWDEYWARATRKGRETQTLGYQEDISLSENEIAGATSALNMILSTRLVVGFHPDQATDACIDLAMLLNVPYCVVPCCVYPRDFPHRQRPDGSRVRAYQELIEYLAAKDPRARMCMLPFHDTATARNIALYTLPSDCKEQEPSKEPI